MSSPSKGDSVPCTLNYAQFAVDCTQLTEKSAILDGAVRRPFRLVENGGKKYIVFQQTKVLDELSEDYLNETESDLNLGLPKSCVDKNSLELQPEREIITAEYQVHYSEIYEVPLLGIILYTNRGAIITAERMLKVLNCARTGPSLGLGDLSFTPHPIYDTPWFQVHPCRTAEIMGELLSKSGGSSSRSNYVLAFLSYYGQAFGLSLDPGLV